ncbi:MAG: mannosyltransferase [Archangium sp.]
MSDSKPTRTPWLEIFAAALPAAIHAVVLSGRLHPDEVFQSLEIGIFKAFGYGIVPWEWQVPPNAPTAMQPWGIRNWSVPLLFSALFKFGDAVGLTSVWARRILAELPQFALHASMLAAVWRLSARRVPANAARLVLWLVALYAPVVWFGGRTMSEAFSVAFLVWGLERLDARDVTPAWWALGGALLGFAQVTRYGSAAVILPAMVWLLVERRWKTFAIAAAGGLAVGGLLGALDFFTWGEWFHSFVHYVRFNVTSGSAAAQYGSSPFWAYVPRLLLAPFAVFGLGLVVRQRAWKQPVLIAVLLGAAAAGLAWKQHWAAPYVALVAVAALAVVLLDRAGAQPSLFVAAAVGYALIVSATAHKEDRFLYPTLVLLSVAGAPAFAKWALEHRAVAGLIAALGLLFFVAPTPFDVQRKEQFQLTRAAAPEATGFFIVNEGLWGSPGFFYLGKNIPWCTCDFPNQGCFQMAARDARFNRGLYWANGGEAQRDASTDAAFKAAGFHVIEVRGQATLYGR